ncbi:CHAT domain-containing protein [Actinomadura sp. 1N219]|uniref:CHAT domain-containing protein n=1 Tax=Actinomadura sp. 1N219 TaxID=3375152 RepID=UPI00379A7584
MTGAMSRLNKVLSGQRLQSGAQRRPRSTGARHKELPKTSPPPVSFSPALSDLAASLPPGVARLVVTRDRSEGAEIFGLAGSCCCGIELPYTAPRTQARPPRLALGSLISPEEDGESPAETWKRLRSWSVHLNEQLHSWLADVRRAHGDDTQLVILDLTDYDLPWELLWLDHQAHAELPNGWLGALVDVTRSTTAIERRQLDGTRRAAKTCRGDVAAFIHHDMRVDRVLLEQLNARIWDTSLDDLFRHLDQPGDPVAFVYIACHGGYPAARSDETPSGAKIKLFDGRSENDFLTVRDIDSLTFRRISNSGSVVFLNACHSGRLAFDPELDDATLRGFAEVFLRSGASGFIGTLGAVGMQAGHEAARRLISQIMRDGHVPIARALRDYRRQIANATPAPSRGTDNAAARQLFPLFHAFMYVYYGAPETALELQPRKVEGA